ncbi:MAG: FMN-binding negative transcriptional regulator [Paracoccaceae bacterium]|jgi:transcriptional regulator|nr:FMN-binding negative transcriptional regulator [Paracoccaceae bacterium]
MHPNQIYRQTPRATAIAFAQSIGFGTLIINADSGPLPSHVPFVLKGDHVELHLVRSNPIARAVTSATIAKLAVLGPHGYVSPDWYGADDQVPTWNYTAVHFSGQLTPLPNDRLEDTLNSLSAEFEQRLLPKTPWTSDKMDNEARMKMMRMIQPFRLDVEDVDSTFKLNQNKPESVRQSAASQIAASDIGQETKQLSALMRGVQSKG